MTNAARLSDSEVRDLTKRLANRPLPRDASAIARRPLSAEHVRRPLGLAPVDEPDDEERGEGMSEARSADIMAWRAKSPGGNRGAHLSDIDILIERALKQERKSSHRDVDKAVEVIGEFLAETVSNLRKEFGRAPETPDGQAALRTDLAELKAALAESRAEVLQLRLLQESMRASSRGERGEPGARGVAGRDGQPGPAGARGESGARAAGFVLNVQEYSASLVLSDGTPAAQLRMRPMFERFAEETAAEDE